MTESKNEKIYGRTCAFCQETFLAKTPGQLYCDIHKNQHRKRQIDRRRLGAQERPVNYYQSKTCVVCKTNFIPLTGNAKYCDKCRIEDQWRKQNPEKAKAVARKAQRRYRHKENGWDSEIYWVLVERDGEYCHICGMTPEDGYYLSVDHDEKTGFIRTLLCGSCNPGMGYFDHDSILLRAAADYIETISLTPPADLAPEIATPIRRGREKGTRMVNGKVIPADQAPPKTPKIRSPERRGGKIATKDLNGKRIWIEDSR